MFDERCRVLMPLPDNDFDTTEAAVSCSRGLDRDVLPPNQDGARGVLARSRGGRLRDVVRRARRCRSHAGPPTAVPGPRRARRSSRAVRSAECSRNELPRSAAGNDWHAIRGQDRELCAVDDPVCSDGLNFTGHNPANYIGE